MSFTIACIWSLYSFGPWNHTRRPYLAIKGEDDRRMRIDHFQNILPISAASPVQCHPKGSLPNSRKTWSSRLFFWASQFRSLVALLSILLAALYSPRPAMSTTGPHDHLCRSRCRARPWDTSRESLNRLRDPAICIKTDDKLQGACRGDLKLEWKRPRMVC